MAVDLPDLFEGVNSVDASSATRRFVRRTLEAGEVVLEAGVAGDEMVGVVHGALQVRAGETVLAMVGAGELVGELALFESARRTVEVVAHTPSEVLVVSRAAYEELRDTAHPVAANLEQATMRHQAQRLREMNDRISRLSDGETRPPGPGFFARVAAHFGRGGLFRPHEVDAVAALTRSGLFDDVPAPVLTDLAESFGVQACGPGHFLCTEGTPGDKLWIIESGEIEVLVSAGTDEVHPLATVGAGALIGAGALVEGGPRMASCVARSRVVALYLDLQGWRVLADDATLRGSALRRAVIRAFASQLAGANAMLERFEQDRTAAALASARSRLVVRSMDE